MADGVKVEAQAAAEAPAKVAETIADLSTYCELFPGDLIFTGTPEGVAAVGPGDELLGRIDGLDDLTIRITE